MKIKSGFVCHSMGDEHVAVAVGERTHEFRGMVRLNGSGAFLWQHMTEDFTVESLIDALLSEYDVDAERARRSAEGFVKKLLDAGIIEE